MKNIPQSLIYEMFEGKPIYYKGYQSYLNGQKNITDVVGSSYLQSLIITKLVYLLISKIGKKYTILTNELGLQFKDKGWRAADIAIIEKERLKDIQATDKYLSIPPKIVIEIDTKAAIEEAQTALSYFHKKTDQLLDFGVEKVLWIFTDSQKMMVAEKDQNWQIIDWNQQVEIVEGLAVNVGELLREDI